MMYASKIQINYNPEMVKATRTVELPDGWLTIEDISKHLKEDEKFSFREAETSRFGSSLFMDIFYQRPENPDELKERIEKQKRYNDNYEKFHNKYKKS